MPNTPQPIRMVSRQTGLSAHVIRVWEKRYQAVTPRRTGTNRRLYTVEEVERLELLKRLTGAGHSIGHIAALSTSQLQALVEKEALSAGSLRMQSSTLPEASNAPSARQFVDEALQATKQLNAELLEKTLHRAVVSHGQSGLLQKILVPLIEEIGAGWEHGELRVAHEHIATAVIRTFLGNYTRSHGAGGGAPHLLVTTPVGQQHELGAILAAATAANHGWRVTYLGPNLPAEEIAGVTLQNNARAVALSVVYPEDDPHLSSELTRLRQMLPPEVALLIGGRAAPAYAPVIQAINATLLADLSDFSEALSRLRKPSGQLTP